MIDGNVGVTETLPDYSQFRDPNNSPLTIQIREFCGVGGRKGLGDMHENTLPTLFVEGVNWAITSESECGCRIVGLKYQSINEYGVL